MLAVYTSGPMSQKVGKMTSRFSLRVALTALSALLLAGCSHYYDDTYGRGGDVYYDDGYAVDEVIYGGGHSYSYGGYGHDPYWRSSSFSLFYSDWPSYYVWSPYRRHDSYFVGYGHRPHRFGGYSDYYGFGYYTPFYGYTHRPRFSYFGYYSPVYYSPTYYYDFGRRHDYGRNYHHDRYDRGITSRQRPGSARNDALRLTNSVSRSPATGAYPNTRHRLKTETPRGTTSRQDASRQARTPSVSRSGATRTAPVPRSGQSRSTSPRGGSVAIPRYQGSSTPRSSGRTRQSDTSRSSSARKPALSAREPTSSRASSVPVRGTVVRPATRSTTTASRTVNSRAMGASTVPGASSRPATRSYRAPVTRSQNMQRSSPSRATPTRSAPDRSINATRSVSRPSVSRSAPTPSRSTVTRSAPRQSAPQRSAPVSRAPQRSAPVTRAPEQRSAPVSRAPQRSAPRPQVTRPKVSRSESKSRSSQRNSRGRDDDN